MIKRKCGLIARVSTLGQARVEEGSTKLQIQMLRNHIKYLNQMRMDGGPGSAEEWTETGTYILEGISGSMSVRSEEFQKLYDDIEKGIVDTVLCTRLDRVSRSIKHFIEFFDYLASRDVGFVCVAQKIDTTTAHGRFITYILMALAELEREQTSERVQITKHERTKKGIWTGGHHPLGYDLSDTRNTLQVNQDEAVLVTHIFTEYLKLGSLRKLVELLNREGHRTKRRVSKRGSVSGGKKFDKDSVRRVLRNKAYIGIMQVNKKNQNKDQDSLKETQKYSEVDALWDPIVPEELFYRVQEVLDKGQSSGHNVIAHRKHNYLLSELLYCGKCLKSMITDSTKKSEDLRYYRYACKTPDCVGSIPAGEIEKAVIDSVSELAFKPAVLARIIEETNDRVTADMPRMKRELQAHRKTLKRLSGKVATLVERLSTVEENAAAEVKKTLEQQSQRKREVEEHITLLESRIQGCGNDKVMTEAVVMALDNFAATIGHLNENDSKALIRSVVNKVYWDGKRGIRIAIYGNSALPTPDSLTSNEKCAERHDWRLVEDSNLRPSG